MIESYPWYITDWRESEAVLTMTAEQRDVYRNLLDICWRDGSLPTDEKALRKMSLAEPNEWKRSWASVSKQFVERDGRLHNAKVDEKRPSIVKSKENRAKGARLATVNRVGNRNDDRNDDRDSHPNDHRNGNRNVHRNPPPSPSPSPEETKPVSSSPDAIFAEILRRHPKKSAPNYAETAFSEILQNSQDVAATALAIHAAHCKWCDYWREIGTHPQFVPKLMDWLNGGDWTQDPPVAEESEPEYPKQMM